MGGNSLLPHFDLISHWMVLDYLVELFALTGFPSFRQMGGLFYIFEIIFH